MTGRFTQTARRVLRQAVTSARLRGAREVSELDVLGALLGVSGSTGARLLGDLGLTPAGLAELAELEEQAARRAGLLEADVAALAELGIDVDDVVARAEQTWGAGALRPPVRRPASRMPVSVQVKALLETAARQSREMRERSLGDEHLVLGLLAGDTPVTEALAARGITWTEARAALTRLRGDSAS